MFIFLKYFGFILWLSKKDDIFFLGGGGVITS